ncbi:MAG: hypothetical protein M1830_002176 [Pleopsidium flavum]|nr:MAG: hypothetical protein M1830_002176 [Pleopsidium flavum]
MWNRHYTFLANAMHPRLPSSYTMAYLIDGLTAGVLIGMDTLAKEGAHLKEASSPTLSIRYRVTTFSRGYIPTHGFLSNETLRSVVSATPPQMIFPGDSAASSYEHGYSGAYGYNYRSKKTVDSRSKHAANAAQNDRYAPPHLRHFRSYSAPLSQLSRIVSFEQPPTRTPPRLPPCDS